MEFLFIDESGDNGFAQGSTEYYIIAGISIRAENWKEYFWKIIELRQQITKKYGLRFDEIKGSDLFSHRGPFLIPLSPPMICCGFMKKPLLLFAIPWQTYL